MPQLVLKWRTSLVFVLNVVFSVTEVFTEPIYERELWYEAAGRSLLSTDSASVSWSLPHAEFCEMHSFAASTSFHLEAK